MQNTFHPLLLIFNFLTITISIAQSVPTSFCGKNQNREPFLHQNTTKTLTISHYKRVYRRFLSDDDAESKEKVGLGTRISLDKIPDHVPDVCKECEKPNGNCGVGLKCICHPKECKDKVISNLSGTLNPAGNSLFPLLSFTVLMIFWNHC